MYNAHLETMHVSVQWPPSDAAFGGPERNKFEQVYSDDHQLPKSDVRGSGPVQ